jgi:hypothetical protein
MSCGPLKVDRRFGGTCCLHLQGRIISQARHHREAGNLLLSCLAYSSTLKRYVPPNHPLTFNGPHDVISHKTAVRTSDPIFDSECSVRKVQENQDGLG